MKMTPWFDGSVKPVRDGVYERKREYSQFNNQPLFSLYKNGSWFYSSIYKKHAQDEWRISYMQDSPWRGLAEEPK